MGDQEREIEGFLGNIQEWQKGRARPFATIFWPGQALANRVRPTELDRFGFHKIFQPTVSSYHFNITQDRICSGGPDTLDELWYQASSYNMTNWALWLGEMLEFYHAHNAQSAQVVVTDTSVTTGAAAATLTCAAGHAYKVKYASTRNNNRATAVTLVYTPSGGTATTIVNSAAVTVAQSQQWGLIGGLYTGNAGVSGMCEAGIWLQAGDTLVTTQGAYVGGDTVEHNFVYEDYTL